MDKNGVSFSIETIKRALNSIYKKSFDIEHNIENELFSETLYLLNLASATGISESVEQGTPEPNEQFLEALKHSNEVFSAFRTHRMQKDIAAQLLDAEGQLKPFSKFVKDVSPYVEHRNRAWLQTEYDTAVIRAHRAAEWKMFEAEKDVYPNLEWLPSTSPDPGADHMIYWGTIRPVDDPFWNEHRPGDRWNCKCELRQTEKEVTSIPESDTESNPDKGLENNTGKDGCTFSDKHAYFPTSCRLCPFSGNKLTALARDLTGKKNCYACKRVNSVIEKQHVIANRKEYERLKADPDYKDVKFNPKTGGLKATHVGHNWKHDDNDLQRFFGNMTREDLEAECQNKLFRMGHKVILKEENIKNKKGETDTSIDMILDNVVMDIASITQDVVNYRNKLISKNSQLNSYNNLEYVNKKADTVCLYFHDPKMFSEQKVFDGMEKLRQFTYEDESTGKTKYLHVAIKHVYCVVNGKNEVLRYDFE